jgi:hypothetical protein
VVKIAKALIEDEIGPDMLDSVYKSIPPERKTGLAVT